MIRYLQFRCFNIEKFCEQPHDNSNCCKLVTVDDPHNHYRENCWYPHAEISGIKFSEDGRLWFEHDDYRPLIVPIPGDWRSYILKEIYPEETAETYITTVAALVKQHEEAEHDKLQRQQEAEEKAEYEVHHGVRRRIK